MFQYKKRYFMKNDPLDNNRMFSNRDLKTLIIPLVIEQILAITVGMADTMMVSAAGEAAVSGVSLVDMVNVLIINIFAALATGGAVVASQLLGAQQQKKACDSAGHLLIVSLVISLMIMGLVLIFREPILRLFFGKIESEVMKNASVYFWISALSYPFIALYNACAALFRSMGNSRVSMVTSILMNGINVAGNAMFVFGFQMGTAGVALASLISRAVAAAVMLILLNNPMHMIHIDLKSRFSFDFSMVKRILHIGIPNSLENSFFQLGRVLVVSVISAFGTVQIAANAVANNLDALGCIPGQAINLAMITVIGQCVGALDFEQAKYYTKKLVKITYLATLGTVAIIFASMPFVLQLYNVSKEAISLAVILVLIHNGSAVLLWPLSFTLPNALRAANDVKYTMIISIFSMGTFRVLFSFILGSGLGWGAIGVWIAMVIDWLFRVGCFLWRFLSGKWLRYKTTPQPEPDHAK